MKRADFYLVESHNQNKLDQVCSSLVHKAYQHKKSVYIHCVSQTQAQNVDAMLWQFQQDNFLPHSLGEEDTIIVDWQNYKWQQDIIINLADTLPPGWINCQRICEVISQDAQARKEARQRWKEYSDREFQVKAHTLNG